MVLLDGIFIIVIALLVIYTVKFKPFGKRVNETKTGYQRQLRFSIIFGTAVVLFGIVLMRIGIFEQVWIIFGIIIIIGTIYQLMKKK